MIVSTDAVKAFDNSIYNKTISKMHIEGIHTDTDNNVVKVGGKGEK